MPIDYYGYQFDDPSVARGARQQGLMGALAGMQQGRQDPNDWAGFLTGAAGGFNQGYQGYLSDYLPIYQQQQKEAEAEAERLRQEEMAGRRVDFMQPLVERMLGGGGQPPGGEFMGPQQGFGGPGGGYGQSVEPPAMAAPPSEEEFIASLNRGGAQAGGLDYSMMPSELFGSQGEYADYLQGQVPQIMKMREAAKQEEQRQQMETTIADQLQTLGIPPTPDLDTNIKLLQKRLEGEMPLDPYRQALTDRMNRQAMGGGGGGAAGPRLTPAQEFTQRRFLYEDALERYGEEGSAEANADPAFEDAFVPEGVQLRGGVATAERPMPEQFGMVLPGATAPPGPSEAPTGTSPAPKQRTLQPAAVKQQAENEAKAENIIRSIRLPADLVDDELHQLVVDMLRDNQDPQFIRQFISENARQHPSWGG